MSTTTQYRPVTIDKIERDGWLSDELADGQSPVVAAIGFTNKRFAELSSNHPAILAWEQVVDEVFADIAPQIRDLFYEALSRRLPWTWEPDR